MTSPRSKRAQQSRGTAALAAGAAASGKVLARSVLERSPEKAELPEKAPRGAAPTSAKALFAAPHAPPAARTPAPVQQALPAASEEEMLRRVFSTPDGDTVMVPERFTSSEDSSFSYKAGHVEGRAGKDFIKVFDAAVFQRDAFFQGWSDGAAMMRAEQDAKARVPTPEVREVREASRISNRFCTFSGPGVPVTALRRLSTCL